MYLTYSTRPNPNLHYYILPILRLGDLATLTYAVSLLQAVSGGAGIHGLQSSGSRDGDVGFMEEVGWMLAGRPAGLF